VRAIVSRLLAAGCVNCLYLRCFEGYCAHSFHSLSKHVVRTIRLSQMIYQTARLFGWSPCVYQKHILKNKRMLARKKRASFLESSASKFPFSSDARTEETLLSGVASIYFFAEGEALA
jgi:hypothetical protein